MELAGAGLFAMMVGIGSFGIAGGLAIRLGIAGNRLRNAESAAGRRLEDAETEAREIILRSQQEGIQIRDESESEARERRREVQQQERRVSRKEEQVDSRLQGFEEREKGLNEKEEDLDRTRVELQETRAEQLRALERVSELTVSEAKDRLLQEVDEEIRIEASRRVRESDEAVQAESTERAYKIMATAMQRYANDVVSELTTTVVSLPSDEMKGRLIGREGRNIRALENATGVNLIVDDTPEVVTISGFDPVRREIARVALSRLIQDGRIQPARVEELVAKAQEEMEETIQKAGEEACYEVRVQGLHPEIIKTIGRLKYRHSYGQNVLQHSIEVGHIAGAIASELGLNQDIVRRAGFLHDIGKALTHEVDGPHAIIGGELLARYNVNDQVVRGVADHHGEEGWRSIDAFVVAAADAISGARPGARRENAEAYIKRLETLEQIALAYDGVDKAYAIQAGREMRVIVRPEQVDDVEALRMARDITKKIQESLEYPGQIKVMVIRETRAIEYAK
ncbi:MAG: ribonuclease Y [Dehalococcoidia bacterium]|jgi:ribonuclease Y|nr:ribonuclease Y [Dehalococcoidia bacterium]